MPNQRLSLVLDIKTAGDEALNRVSAGLERIAATGEKAGKSTGQSFSSFPAQIKQAVQDPLAAAENSLTKFASGFGPIGVAAGAGITALSLFATASYEATRSLAALGVETQNISLKTGLSIKEVGLFSFAAKAAGQDIGIFETGMRKLSQGLVDGGAEGKKAADALRSLGVSSRTSSGEIRPMGEIFEDIGTGLNKISSTAAQTTTAVALFGKGGSALIPVLKSLGENLNIGEGLHLGLSDGEEQKLLEYQKRITAMDAVWETAKRHFAEGIAGTVFINLQGAGASVLEALAKNGGAPGAGVVGLAAFSSSLAISALEGIDAARFGKRGGSPIFELPEGTTGPLLPSLDVQKGDAIARNFQTSRLGSTEGLNAQIQELETKNSNLGAQLQPGSGVGADAQSKAQSEYAANQKVIDSLKAQIKTIDEVRAAYEGLGKRVAEAQGSLLGPASKLYGELDTLVGKGASRARLQPGFDVLASASLEGLLDTARETDAKGGLRYSGAIGDVIGGGALFRGARAAASSADQGRHNDHDFGDSPENARAMESTNRLARGIIGDLKDYNSLHDDLVKKSGSEAVSSIERGASFNSRLLSSNTNLSDAQKVAEEYRIGAQAADAIYLAQLKTADLLSTEKERAEANDAARLSNELNLQKVKEDGIVRIAELEAQKVNGFRGLIGDFFDAGTSRNPRAIADLVKSQGLGLARTVTENAAQQYLYPTIQKLIPHFSGTAGSLLKDTPFGVDPLKGSATALDGSAVALTGAAKALLASARGGTVNADGTVSDSGGSSGGTPNSAGILDGDIASLGSILHAGLSPASLTPATSTNLIAKLLGGGAGGSFGSGVGSAATGYGLSVLTDPGFNTASRVGAGVGLAGGLAAGGYGIYTGIKEGGLGGDLKAAGSAAGLAGGIVSNVSKLLGAAGPLLDAIPIVGSIAALALPLIGGLFGNNPQKRENAINSELSLNAYLAPTALNLTQSTNGKYTSFDARGGLRTSDLSPYPETTNPFVYEQTHGTFSSVQPTFFDVPGRTVSPFSPAPTPPVIINHNYTVHTLDSQSFHEYLKKNGDAVGDTVATHLQNTTGNGRLSSAIQYAVSN